MFTIVTKTGEAQTVQERRQEMGNDAPLTCPNCNGDNWTATIVRHWISPNNDLQVEYALLCESCQGYLTEDY